MGSEESYSWQDEYDFFDHKEVFLWVISGVVSKIHENMNNLGQGTGVCHNTHTCKCAHTLRKGKETRS